MRQTFEFFNVAIIAIVVVGGSVRSLIGDDKSTIVQQQFQGVQIEYFKNSPTLSQATGLNAAGSIIGFKESPKTSGHVYFYCDQEGFVDMPMPKGYTNVEATAISDTNLVVGRAMKTIGSEGSLRALVWQPRSAEIKLLPVPDGDSLSDACDVSADGKRITGYATGRERFRPVVWQWNEKQSEWQVEVLPTLHENNPYLMSSQLIISPDGNTIVGCCTEKITNGVLDSALFEWRQVDGKWTRRLVTEQQMYVKAINNKGEIAGSLSSEQGRLPCLVTLAGDVQRLDLLVADVAGEARDISNESIIVGWSDDARLDGGPRPCTWTLDRKAKQLELSDSPYGMLYAINEKGQIAGSADFIPQPASAEAGDESAMLAVRITRAK